MIQNHPLFIFGGAPQAHGELRGYPLRGYPLRGYPTRLSSVALLKLCATHY